MCGIIGYYSLSNEKVDKIKFDESLLTLIHRGPDFQQSKFYKNGTIALGHARLAIIDLKPCSNQPMEINNYRIVFNGEIYNYIELRKELIQKGYSFTTKSDTEVIINAFDYWGEDCVSRFNGMWAFAILNETDNSLFCSRDRYGIKPFNYYADENKFIFGSEIKSIIYYDDSLRKPNYNAISLYCRESIDGEIPETWFENILRLLPGHNLTLKSGKINIKKYYYYPSKTIPTSFEAAKKEFYDLFIDSVKLRMRSDVPVGSTLSGGLDSSSIVAGLRTFYPGTHETFTAHFPGFINDEYTTAEKTNNLFKLNGNPIQSEYKDDYLEVLSEIIYHLESGNSSTSIFPLWKIYEKAKDKVTVVLEGQGADELLAGYITTFGGTYIKEMIKRFRLRDAYKEFKLLRKNYSLIDFIILHLRSNLPSRAKTFVRRNILKYENVLIGELKQFKYTYLATNNSDSKLKEKLQEAHQTTLVSLLHYGDAISMAFSIENRLPFMDFRLVDFVMTLPNEFLIADGKGKYIQREAMRDLLPDYINNDVEKLGFPSPVDDFFLKNESLLENFLLEPKTLARGLFSEKKLRKLIFNSSKAYINSSTFIFRLICVELWFRKFIDVAPSSSGKIARFKNKTTATLFGLTNFVSLFDLSVV